MDYRKQYMLQIIVRIILITINSLFIVLFAFQLNWIFTSIFLSGIIIIQVILLIIYLNKVNRDLANFFLYLQEKDTSIKFIDENIPYKFKGLANAFQLVTKEFKNITMEHKKSELLINLLINQVSTGLLIFDKEFKVRLFNKAFLELLDISEIVSINSLKNKSVVYELLLNLKPAQQKIILLENNKQLLVSMQIVKDDKDELKIFSFHDVAREMNEKELESYNGLIRVLTHEIMNTLTPMSTVVDTIYDCLTEERKEKDLNKINEKDISDAVKSLNIIEDRTEGLKSFVKRFRQFIHIPELNIEEIHLDEFITKIQEFFQQGFEHNIQTNISDVKTIYADKELLQQVIINLLKNSIEATSDNIKVQIDITAFQKNDSNIIQIRDNGSGIPDDVIDKVFIPFFTTKENGNGIGLSLSRLIMFKHGGDLKIKSDSNGTCVSLILKK